MTTDPSDPEDGQHGDPVARSIVLVGMMGAGKSSVGKRLASRLQLPFVDTDAEIERRSGRSIGEMFDVHGETTFRVTEQEVLAELLASPDPMVVATGGGVVTVADSRRLLRERGTVVWLRASADVLVHRMRDDHSRPLLGDDPRANLRKLIAERDPLYREVADHVVDVDRVDRRRVVELVLAALGTPLPRTPAVGEESRVP